MTSEVMNDCIAQCGIRHVLTSRRVMEKFNLKLERRTGLPGGFQGQGHAGRQALPPRPWRGLCPSDAWNAGLG